MTHKKQLAVFCNNITGLRKKHDLTHLQMSDIMGISVDSLIEIEQGSLPKTVGIDVIFKLSAFFNCTYASLFTQK